MKGMKLPCSRTPALKLRARHVDFWFGTRQVLFDVNLDILENQIVALIGPPGAGHTTFLRCLNGTHSVFGPGRLEGKVELNGINILNGGGDRPSWIRFAVVPQGPNLAPGSVYSNVIASLAAARPSLLESERRDIVEDCLRAVGLWDTLGDRLDASAEKLRPGDQQLLCIARAMALDPEMLLLDKPCSEMGPNATDRIEAVLRDLAEDHTILFVTSDAAQAQRVADRVAFFSNGRVLEAGEAHEVFKRPSHPETKAFLARHLR